MEVTDSIFSEILTDGPSPGTLLLILSKIKEDGSLEEVIQGCLKALSVYPNDIYIRRLLAETYFEDGQLSQAKSELEKVITRIDSLMSSYILQAEILIQQKKEHEAVELLKLYLAHRPDDRHAFKLLSKLQIPEEAISDYEPVIEEASPELFPKERELTPEVEPSLDKLEGMPDHTIEMEDEEEDRIKLKKIKMIAILESWLESIRELPIEG